MAISEDLISRLDGEAGQHLLDKARTGRKRALEHITTYAVTLTIDGQSTWEEVFDRPPTLEQVAARVGTKVFVLGMRKRRRGLTSRFLAALVA